MLLLKWDQGKPSDTAVADIRAKDVCTYLVSLNSASRSTASGPIVFTGFGF